jgi:hypothetical protein
MPSPPTFFLSYARGDVEEGPGNLVTRFFTDLERRVAMLDGKDPRESKFGMYDLELEQGGDWIRRMGAALKTHHVLVTLLSPLYFNRENCGRELAAFIRRFAPPQVDAEGRLCRVENILPIRWMEVGAFSLNGVADAVVPPLLRSVEWRVASDGGDPALEEAIQRYMRRGMENCIKPGREYYKLLVENFAKRIWKMPHLEPGTEEPDLVAGDNAFTARWLRPPAPVANELRPAVDPAPGPDSLATIYVTTARLLPDPREVSFAETLLSTENAGAWPDWLAITVGAVYLAATSERLAVYQGASCMDHDDEPPSPLLHQLAALSERNVLTVLIIDPSLWSDLGLPPALADVLRDPCWRGTPAIVMPAGNSALRRLEPLIAQWNAGHGMERPVASLPADPGEMYAKLRSLFVAGRGMIMRSGTPLVPQSNQTMPTVHGVGAIQT